MAALLVSSYLQENQLRAMSDVSPQIFKIVSPYIILAIAFSILNARLHLPPFSLFLVALTLTDSKCLSLGPLWVFQRSFADHADVLLIFSTSCSHDDHFLPECHRYGFVARDRTDYQLLLYQLPSASVVGRHLCSGRSAHGWPTYRVCGYYWQEVSVARLAYIHLNPLELSTGPRLVLRCSSINRHTQCTQDTMEDTE